MNLYWWLTPVVTAGIGWGTNWLAVKMLFRPKKAWNLGICRLQGVVPKRKAALGRSISEIVSERLLSSHDLAHRCHDLNLKEDLQSFLNERMDLFLQELKKEMPMVGLFMGGDLAAKVRSKMMTTILDAEPEIKQLLAERLEKGVNVAQLVEEKIAQFSIEELESLVCHIASKELRTIEVLGGLLGFIVGLVQVLVFYLWQ